MDENSQVEVWRGGRYIYTFNKPDVHPGEEAPNLRSPNYPPYLFRVRAFEESKDGRIVRVHRRVPNLQVVDQVTYDKLPRFLYRVSHDSSGGSSSNGVFQSASIKDGLGQTEMSTLSREDITQNIYLHLCGYRSSKGTQFFTPWISFTDSLMFAYWYALRLKGKGRQDIKFHIIDTYTIKNPVTIAHSYSISKAFRVGAGKPRWWYKKMIGGTYTEFLVWNTIEVTHADEVDFEKMLAAEKSPLGDDILRPSTKDLFNYRRARKREKVAFTVMFPAGFRKKRFEDEAETDFKRKARLGPGAYKAIREESYASASKQASPRKDRKIVDSRFPIDELMFEAGLQVARLFKLDFQLDILVGLFALRTQQYYPDSIVEHIATSRKAAAIINEMKYYPTGLKSYKKKEVQAHQQIWLDCAAKLHLPVVQNHNRPARNLVGLVGASLPQKNFNAGNQTELHIDDAAAPGADLSGQTLDDLDSELHELDSRTQVNRKRKSRAISPSAGPNTHSVVVRPAENPLIRKRGKLAAYVPANIEESMPSSTEIVFQPDIDSYHIGDELHEGIIEYLRGTSLYSVPGDKDRAMKLLGTVRKGDDVAGDDSGMDEADEELDEMSVSSEEDEVHVEQAKLFVREEDEFVRHLNWDE